jgi:thiol-disulfide isomerase/thioredoxin
LPDAFAEVQLAPGLDPAAPLPLKSLSYPSLDGPARTLDDPELHGKATIISLFGSWCPNCNDEAALWAELYELYYPRGLRIIGLGFELSGEVERDKKQLLRFRERWNLRYPIFLAGSADKEKAQLAFPLLAQVKSFPTALFLDGSGRVRAIHSGFAGPATGQTGARLRARYVELIELLLAEEK